VDKRVDINFSLSHNIFLNGNPKAKMSSVTVDKKGGFKVLLNVLAEIIVETEPGEWKSARTMYLTFTAKFMLQP
jgi:hypothetical protein